LLRRAGRARHLYAVQSAYLTAFIIDAGRYRAAYGLRRRIDQKHGWLLVRGLGIRQSPALKCGFLHFIMRPVIKNMPQMRYLDYF